MVTPGEQVGNERFWGYFWGYFINSFTTRPFRISRLRHLFDCLPDNPFARIACNGLVTLRAYWRVWNYQDYKYSGMMGLSVGVNTHSHIKMGGLRSFNRPTFNAIASKVGRYTLDCNRLTTVPLRSFKHYTHCFVVLLVLQCTGYDSQSG